MELRWLKTGYLGAERCEVIVVFGGWAVGAEVFAHLEGRQDILFVSDYRDLEADLRNLAGYGRVMLLAWSFGVASYAHWQATHPDPFHRKVAVNGTLSPISREAGIPPAAMQKTIETLSPGAYQLFLSRVFGGRQPEAAIDVEARKQELLAVEARGDAPSTVFDRIWISTQDKIFPPASMARAWEGQPICEISAPHAPFGRFRSWEDLFA